MTVAPLTGAWIETSHQQPYERQHLVAPLTGAWIETKANGKGQRSNGVAPLTGAWIETCSRTWCQLELWVAPLTGAWIETRLLRLSWQCWKSHPSRVRGLKLQQGLRDYRARGRTPHGCVD